MKILFLRNLKIFWKKSWVINNSNDEEKIEIKDKKKLIIIIKKNENKLNIDFNMENNYMYYPIYNYMDFYNYGYNNNLCYNDKTNDIQKIINNINKNMNKNYYSFPYNNKKIKIKKEINQKE